MRRDCFEDSPKWTARLKAVLDYRKGEDYNSPNRRTMGNVQGVGFAGPWIPESAFAGTGTIMRPRLFMGYKNESYK